MTLAAHRASEHVSSQRHSPVVCVCCAYYLEAPGHGSRGLVMTAEDPRDDSRDGGCAERTVVVLASEGNRSRQDCCRCRGGCCAKDCGDGERQLRLWEGRPSGDDVEAGGLDAEKLREVGEPFVGRRK